MSASGCQLCNLQSSDAAGPCYPAHMRVVLGVVLALLFAVHTASAASPRPLDCCEEMCVDVHCVATSCAACPPLALPATPRKNQFLALDHVSPTSSLMILPRRIEDIWRPPWQLV